MNQAGLVNNVSGGAFTVIFPSYDDFMTYVVVFDILAYKSIANPAFMWEARSYVTTKAVCLISCERYHKTIRSAVRPYAREVWLF